MLNERPSGDANGNLPEAEGTPDNMPSPGAANQQTTNHFFHFDGKSWILLIFNVVTVLLIFNFSLLLMTAAVN